MDVLTSIFIFLLLLTQCITNQGGRGSVQLFFCTIPGCADNVTHVFCNDEDLFNGIRPIPDCTGLPPPNTTCQHGGRAFVSFNATGICEFEGSGYITTEKCAGNYSNICDFFNATASSPIPKRDRVISGYIIGGVCGLLLIGLGIIILDFWIKKCKKPPRDFPNDGPGLEDGSSPFVPEHQP